MNPRLKLSAFAMALVATTLTAGGVAMAATPAPRNHARLETACSTLSGQWSSAKGDHSRHIRAARSQERMGQRDCRSNKTAELKAGVHHYRSALHLIGVRPNA